MSERTERWDTQAVNAIAERLKREHENGPRAVPEMPGCVQFGSYLWTLEDAVRQLLLFIGEDPRREGLEGTPGRVARAWREMTAGYHEDPFQILNTQFDEGHDELVIVRGVEFFSTCEHHLLPFSGTATIGYLPGRSRRVVGLSKLARVVQTFAKRLQVQERMTREIAQSVHRALNADGAGCIVRAKHLCMGCRGVKQPHAEMVTSSLLGTLRDNPDARSEFLSLGGTS